MLHHELIDEFPCDGDLVLVEKLSTEDRRMLWCAGCGTEITYWPDCEWVFIVLRGMRSELDV
jgi:hypothetical protein